MRKLAVLGLLAALAGVLVWWTASGSRSDPEEAPRPGYEGARVTPVDGVVVVRLAGPPRVKGRAHGESLAPEIRAWLERLRPTDPGEAEFALRTCGERLAPHVPPALREELEGLAEGAGISLPEALYLNYRFELAAFGFVEGAEKTLGFAAPAAVGPGPEVLRLFAAKDLHGRTGDLVLFLHEDRDPPLVLLALPGMVGGFAGLAGGAGATLRPAPDASTPSLAGLGWTLLVRALLEEPSVAEDALPPRTVHASLPMVVPGRGTGNLNVSPGAATWYAAPRDAPYAAATDEPAGAPRARDRAWVAEQARMLLGGRIPEGIVAARLKGSGDGFAYSLVEGDRRRRISVRFWD